MGADAKRRNDVASAVASIRRTWNTAGYLTPTPPPPIVIGGFGPKMAALAGRVGDGFNTQAGHPDLGRPAGFRISVFAGLSRAWLEPGGAGRRRLESLGVDRIVLLVSPPFSAETITAAGRLLG